MGVNWHINGASVVIFGTYDHHRGVNNPVREYQCGHIKCWIFVLSAVFPCLCHTLVSKGASLCWNSINRCTR